jgi:serpin B
VRSRGRRYLILAGVFALVAALSTGVALSQRSARASAEPVPPVRGHATGATDASLLAQPLDSFGLALLSREASASAGNVVLSPFSVHDVLSMILTGAQGKTAAEMRSTLGLGSLPLSRVDQAWAALIASAQAGRKPAAQVANSLWLKHGVPFDPDFLKTNRDYFAAGSRALPDDHDAAARAINSWVAGHTNGVIRKIVEPSYFNAQTILALVNTVHLKTAWKTPFSRDDTSSRQFTLGDGTVVKVPTMYAPLSLPLARGEGYDAVALQTKSQVTVWVVVPKGDETAEALLGSFATDGLSPMYESAESTPVVLDLPRFKTTFTAPDLGPQLAAMGMPSAFSPDEAELQGIVAPGTPARVYIQRVVHKAVLDVNESGIEAAAATAGIVGTTSMPVAPVSVRADRPFLMVVTLKGSNAPLFMALVRDPRS